MDGVDRTGERVVYRMAMLAILLVSGVFGIVWGEKVPAGHGLGWDGKIYADLVRSLDVILAQDRLSDYYAQRVGPSFVVRQVLAAIEQPFTDSNIIFAFGVYNLILTLLSCAVWQRIATIYRIGVRGEWIGFVALFVNFSMSKQMPFYPVLTDPSGFLGGLLLLLFYSEGRRIALLATGVLGAFCWPTLAITGAILLIFPRRTDVAFDYARAAAWPKVGRRIWLALVATLIGYAGLYALLLFGRSASACAAIVDPAHDVLLSHLPRFDAELHIMAPDDACKNIRQVLTGLPAIAAMLLCLWLLIGSWGYVRTIPTALKRSGIVNLLFAVAAIALPLLARGALVNPDVENASSVYKLAAIILMPIEAKVFLPWVSIAVFWGPAIVVMTLAWPAICREMRGLGLGPVVVLLLLLPFVLASEPRFITTIWPIMVLATALMLQRAGSDRRYFVLFVLLSVVFAQFWLPLTIMPWTGGDYDGLLLYPKQLYFMHYGLWMSWPSYLMQSVLLGVSSLLFFARRSKQAGEDDRKAIDRFS